MTAKEILSVAREWVGRNEYDGSYKAIIDTYNSHKPLAVGYPVKYSDDWCDAFVSAVAIKAGAVDLIGTECGCERHVHIWKKLGIWNEDGSITPRPGDIIVYSWKRRVQPNNGFADHVGFVESVRDGVIHTIEGNRTAGTGNPAVRRMTVPVGHGQIRGFAQPRYEAVKPAPSLNIEEVARQVYRGEWGSGDARKRRLTEAGYDYDAVQDKVEELYYPKANKTVEQIAHEIVVEGKWGNDPERSRRLIDAGYDAEAVRKAVNRLMRYGK